MLESDNLINAHDGVTLYFSSANTQASDVLRQVVNQTGLIESEAYPNVLSVQCEGTRLTEFSTRCSESLSGELQDDIACHVQQFGSEPSLSQLMQSRSLRAVLDQLDGKWISDILAERRLITYFQPIVRLNDPRDVFGYECLVRGVSEAGQVIPPFLMFGVARRAKLICELDHAARVRAFATIAQLDSQEKFFINFSPRVLQTNHLGVKSTIDAALDAGISTRQIVVEVTESDEIHQLDQVLNQLHLFREAGFGIALDDVGAGYSSLTILADIRPDFVKIDMDLIRGANQDRYRGCIVRKLLELSSELEICTVAEGIETMDEWAWARDQGADLGQGYLFAKPEAHLQTIDEFATSETIES
ncbi:MAG: EAL domain-containing protein [Pirellulaceae bacterium]